MTHHEPDRRRETMARDLVLASYLSGKPSDEVVLIQALLRLLDRARHIQVTDAMAEASLRQFYGEDWPGAFDEFEIGCWRIDMEKAICAALKVHAESERFTSDVNP